MPRPGIRLSTTIAAAVLALCAVTARAADEIYTVDAVAVDVRAESAAQARKQALAEAHHTAFDRLLRRIVPSERLPGLPEVSRERIAGMVSSFAIENSQTSDVRYLGELSFSFDRGSVRRFLRRHEIPFAETRSSPAVVLALHGSRENAVLWSDPNPWRQAWVRRPNATGLVPFAVPLGDLGDIQAIAAEAALTHAREPLAAIAARYDAGKTLVTRANFAGDAAAGTAAVRTVSALIPRNGESESFSFTVEQREGESREELYDRTADRVAQRVQDIWKRANLLQFDERSVTTVDVPLNALAEWVRVRRRLVEVPVVARVEVRTLSRTGAEVRVEHFGGREQFATALSQHRLRLTQPEEGADARPILRSAGAVAEPAIEDDVAPTEG